MVEVGVVSKDEKIIKRLTEICKEFDYSIQFWPDLMTFMESDPDCMVVITNASENKESVDAAAECAQTSKATCSSAFIVCVVEKETNKDNLPFLKKSGADLILLEDELFSTSKLEFLLTQELKARYYPIKTNELKGETELTFHLYHLLPSRGKFLPCAFPGSVLTDTKLSRLSVSNELYIARREIKDFKKYNEKHVPQSMESRCRIRFLSLCASYSDLVFLLTDQGEVASFEKGKKLLEDCKSLCNELIATVGEFDDVWKIINNSAIGNMASVERSTAVATYAVTFGLNMELESALDDVMVCSLLSDIGMLFLAPNILRKLRDDVKLSSDEQSVYEFHPMKSVSVALEHKLPMTPALRKIIEMTHERCDGRGFPMKPLADRIPLESQLIQFCQEFDSKNLIKIGKLRKDPFELRQEMIKEEIKSNKYSPKFSEKISCFLK